MYYRLTLILQCMCHLLSLIWGNVQEYFAITWNSNTTQTNWSDSDFAQTIWAKICWVGALFCTFLYSRVSTSDPSDRPCVPQRATLCPPVCQQFRTSCETAKSRLFYNGGKRFNWFMSCDDQFLQAQASFRTSETSTSLQLPKLQE